jgi:hypothetical protein
VECVLSLRALLGLKLFGSKKKTAAVSRISKPMFARGATESESLYL